MRRKSAVAVVSRHELPMTNRGLAGSACLAPIARDHGGHDDVAAFPSRSVFSREHNPPRDLVTENERQRLSRRHTGVRETDVRVTHATACHLDDDVVGPRLEVALARFQGLALLDQLVAMGVNDGHAILPFETGKSAFSAGNSLYRYKTSIGGRLGQATFNRPDGSFDRLDDSDCFGRTHAGSSRGVPGALLHDTSSSVTTQVVVWYPVTSSKKKR